METLLKTILIVLMLFVGCQSARAETTYFDDGGTHWLDTTYDVIRVLNSTTVNFLSGSYASEARVFDNSVLNLLDGEIVSLRGMNNSTSTIWGGLLSYTGSNSFVDDNASLTFFGGTVLRPELRTSEYGNAQIFVHSLNFSGSFWNGFNPEAPTDTMITIYGTDFKRNGNPVGYGFQYWGDQLTGLYGDASPVDNYAVQVTLAPPVIWPNPPEPPGGNPGPAVVPAPGAILLGSIGVGIVGALRRRRTL